MVKRAHALQYSVFIADLTLADRKKLAKQVIKRIDPQQDDVRFYPVPPGAEMRVTGPSRLPEGVSIADSKVWTNRGKAHRTNAGEKTV